MCLGEDFPTVCVRTFTLSYRRAPSEGAYCVGPIILSRYGGSGACWNIHLGLISDGCVYFNCVSSDIDEPPVVP